MPQFSFHGSNFITISANKRGFCKAVTSCIAESFLRFWPSIQAVSIAAYGKDQETLHVFTFILREPAFGFYLDNLESISRFGREKGTEMADISLVNVCKTYKGGQNAVKDFNLDIRDRELIIFVGPSGCGKSTTLRMIAGLEDISSGELWMDDCLMNMVEPKNRNLSMVFQNYALYPHMTVYENMAFGLRVRRTAPGEIDARVREAARILEISHLLDRRPAALSGGQKQRVAIGSVIVRKPKAYLMDEPLSNLDAKLRAQMRVEIAKLHKQLNATIIYVTHDQEEALAISDRIAVIKEGEVMQVGSPENIYKKPQNTFVAGFIGVSNFVECDVNGENPAAAVLDIKGECTITCSLKAPFKGKGIISARPEQLFFDEKEGLPGKIVISTFLGDFIEYEIELDNGQTVQLNEYTKDVRELRPDGQRVKVNFDINAVGVYDAGTQEVISW